MNPPPAILPPAILQIALDVPLDTLFDYLDGGFQVKVGQRVVVPFGRRQLVGIVVARIQDSTHPIEKLKSVVEVFNQETPLAKETFNLVKFCADYYQYPFGQALLSVLPSRLKQIKPAETRKQYEYVLTRHGASVDVDSLPKRKMVLRKVIQAFLSHNTMTESALKEISSTWRKAAQELIAMQYIERREAQACLEISPSNQITSNSNDEPDLNNEQNAAVEAVLNQHDTFMPFLLHGITGSGKTEVYMQILSRILSGNDGQALVLVPEINLTPQLEQRFRNRFRHVPLVSLHSNLGEGERLQNWRLAQSGQARIIIGTRLAVFTPLPKLKIVIVDEEHDNSYKQQDSMRYHARDVAILRAQRAKVPVVLGSATPSLETWHHGQTSKYQLLNLKQRAVSQSALPDIRCIDTSKVEVSDGLTVTLVEAIRERLAKKEQSLLFINRRGYSPVLLCNACHWIAPCTRCSSRLVVHLKQNRLRCHYCGHEQKMVRQCPSCGNPDLHPTGQGTQRIEETLKSLFPEARVQRVDRDTTRNKHALTDILAAVNADEVDILIGTQMLAKGHDFPNLTLVGVVDADSALFSPDFRAAERLFAQLIQVSGRAGRAKKPGEVLIQTAYPEHQLFNAIRLQNYASFAKALIKEREITAFPPFTFLALLRAEANQYNLVQQFLTDAMTRGRVLSHEVMIYDPLRPQMEKLKGMERGHILFQASQRTTLQLLLKNLVPQLRAHALTNKVRWSVDVDPLEF
jgi:primosomal protein N' (replication factor Y) (superfamily II helicase)